ncbi:helix-turn-helix domain-containing protein [Flavobacterium sp. 25HG05S-40]|uniref:helix-turn-helix domain-containing protein n=1 Tax=Flavobacterium sp. 25HG05S-40 TaxID=3458682 RepID=UPI004044BE0A
MPVYFLCFMQKQIEEIEVELIQRIYKLFLEKFNGNNSEFAKASQCSETTIRRIFSNKQGITINLLLRMCYALNTTTSEVLKGLSIKS